MTELDAIIKIMGKPEDFGGDPIDEKTSDFKERRSNQDYKYIKTGKRLFRDNENKVVGGVCSGIANYLGFDDPIWVRLFFGIMMFTGVTELLYPFLWIAIPKAKSSSDKLAMKGEPINIDNIAKKVEEEIESLTQKINDFGEDISNRSKNNDWNFSNKRNKEHHP
jgi:phage shock protein PspC (stress-responsive transcriptional regulator)